MVNLEENVTRSCKHLRDAVVAALALRDLRRYSRVAKPEVNLPGFSEETLVPPSLFLLNLKDFS